MRRAAEKARRLILQVPNVQKVELLGVQEEKVYVEIENAKLASLGIPPTAISSAIKSQNVISPSAMVETETDNVYLRITGTLITCMGFIPIAFAKGITSEFCQSMFPVIAMSLLVSWFVSVMVAPLFGTYLIKVKVTDETGSKKDDMYQSRFYVIFRSVLKWCLTHKAVVIAATAGVFAASVVLMDHVHQEFFPQSVRPEIIMSMRLPEGSSLKDTEEEGRRFAEFLDAHRDKIENYSYYVGTGAPRFVLTIDPVADSSNFAQFVIVSKDVDSRNEMTAAIRKELPLGYSITPAGSLEDSDTAMDFLLTPVPVTVFIVVTLLMIQLRRVKLVILTLLTASMGVIGVTFGMLFFDKALGFVAYFGILALMGMIIRNSVVLIDQIEKHLEEGETPWDAVVDSAIKRFRPIMLTAATTILGMLPLMTSAFWGPMATAIACGLVIATALTLLVLPTMYAAFYRIKEE